MSSEVRSAPAEAIPGQQTPVSVTADPRTQRNRQILRQLVQLLAVAAVGVASYLVFSHYVVCSVQVRGSSMFPTLRDSERYLLNRWILLVRKPQASEVVVIRDPADNGLSVKRIVGLPGDSVLLKDGKVFVNGEEQNEYYLPRLTKTFPNGVRAKQEFVCRKNEYVVLGDNRNNSIDSRSYGPVPAGRILGLVVR